jgi:hypothetical protein
VVILTYTKTLWNEGGAPGISAANLNKIEQGIADAHAQFSSFLKKDGTEKMTGDLNFSADKSIKVEGINVLSMFGPPSSGYGVALGSGGLTIVGGGESWQATRDGLLGEGQNGGYEQLFLSSDNDIYLNTNLQNGWGDRLQWAFYKSGNFASPHANGGILDQYFNLQRKSGSDGGSWNVMGPTGTKLFTVNWNGSGSVIEKSLIIDNVSDIDATDNDGLTIRGGGGKVKFDDNEMYSTDANGNLKAWFINASYVTIDGNYVYTAGGNVNWGTGNPSGGGNGDIYIQY